MKYYIIPPSLAATLHISGYRHGNESAGYLCNIGDLAAYGPERAVAEGAQEITLQEAKQFVKQYKL